MAWPIIAAGAVSALSNIAGGMMADSAARRAAQADLKFKQQALDLNKERYNEINPLFNPYVEYGNSGLSYTSDPRSFETSPEEMKFNYDQNISNFLDPQSEYAQNEMRRQLEANAAVGGSLQSGGYAKELQANANDLALKGWQQAMDNQNRDRSQKYQEFAGFINNLTSERSNRFNRGLSLVNTGMNAVTGKANLATNNASAMTNIYGDMGTLQGQIAGGGNGTANAFTGIGTNTIPQIIGSYYGNGKGKG